MCLRTETARSSGLLKMIPDSQLPSNKYERLRTIYSKYMYVQNINYFIIKI